MGNLTSFKIFVESGVGARIAMSISLLKLHVLDVEAELCNLSLSVYFK